MDVLDYVSHPNQEYTTVHKSKKCLFSLNKDSVIYTMKDLTPAQFQVWLYYAKNANNFEFWVSPAAAYKEYGISPSTFRQTKRILKQKGYLVQSEKKGIFWDFYEIPQNVD